MPKQVIPFGKIIQNIKVKIQKSNFCQPFAGFILILPFDFLFCLRRYAVRFSLHDKTDLPQEASLPSPVLGFPV